MRQGNVKVRTTNLNLLSREVRDGLTSLFKREQGHNPTEGDEIVLVDGKFVLTKTNMKYSWEKING